MSEPRRRAPAAAQEEALPLARRLARRGDSLFFRRRRTEQRLPMVGWFDPGQLLDTGLQTLFSLVVGERSDRRIVQALAARRPDVFDYTHHYVDTERGPRAAHDRVRDELWLDYVCDTGDGWNSTYAVAYAAAQPALALADGEALPRADVLVFGGDQVYPTASREEYQRRLVAPFDAAFGDAATPAAPHVFAVPGNHDWYDGLSAFSRLFCSDIGGRWFAGWRTRQRRSYFALKLPHRWWLLGCDGQLQSDLDTPQIEYFRWVAEHHMQPGDRVILCVATPFWVYAHKYRQIGGELDETDLLFLREAIFRPRGVEVQVYLSGDLHHYRRHEEVGTEPGAAMQKITAGGGGAFLHPTHDEDVALIVEDPVAAEGQAREYALRAQYPDARTSNRLTWGNLLFPLRNPRFGIVPAVLYLLTAWLVTAAVGDERPRGAFAALGAVARAFRDNPGLTLWVLALAFVFVTFTRSRSRLQRVGGGLVHLGAHWVAIFWLAWGATWVAGWIPASLQVSRFVTEAVLVFAGGWLAGSLIMGLYLLLSLNLFGRHSEEAFSSLRIEDYKHFLRLHVGPDGALTIHPLKVERVPRRWRARAPADASPSRVQPDGPLVVERIEPPVRVRAPRPG
jgi:hypothetical protein